MTTEPVKPDQREVLHSRRDAQQNRERILRAAAAAFAERGRDAEMKDIAERAEVGIGTLYRNYPSKEALIEGVIEEFEIEAMPDVERAMAIEPADEALRYLTRRIIERVHDYGQLAAVLMSSRPDLVDSAKRRLRVYAIEILERGVRQGIIRDDLPPAFLAAALQSTMPELYLRLSEEYPPEQVVEGCVELLVASVLRNPAAQGT